jgi:hypothetical protein
MFKAGMEFFKPYLNCTRFMNEASIWPDFMKDAAKVKPWLRERKMPISVALRTATGPDPALNAANPPGVETVTKVIQQAKLAFDTLAPGGDFMFCIDPLPIDPMLPDANIEAAIRVAREYGKCPFKKARKITESFDIIY